MSATVSAIRTFLDSLSESSLRTYDASHEDLTSDQFFAFSHSSNSLSLKQRREEATNVYPYTLLRTRFFKRKTVKEERSDGSFADVPPLYHRIRCQIKCSSESSDPPSCVIILVNEIRFSKMIYLVRYSGDLSTAVLRTSSKRISVQHSQNIQDSIITTPAVLLKSPSAPASSSSSSVSTLASGRQLSYLKSKALTSSSGGVPDDPLISKLSSICSAGQLHVSRIHIQPASGFQVFQSVPVVMWPKVFPSSCIQETPSGSFEFTLFSLDGTNTNSSNIAAEFPVLLTLSMSTSAIFHRYTKVSRVVPLLGLHCNSENSSNYFELLSVFKSSLVSSGIGMVPFFVSDGFAGIETVVRQIFPSSLYFPDVVHAKRNFLDGFKKMSGVKRLDKSSRKRLSNMVGSAVNNALRSHAFDTEVLSTLRSDIVSVFQEFNVSSDRSVCSKVDEHVSKIEPLFFDNISDALKDHFSVSVLKRKEINGLQFTSNPAELHNRSFKNSIPSLYKNDNNIAVLHRFHYVIRSFVQDFDAAQIGDGDYRVKNFFSLDSASDDSESDDSSFPFTDFCVVDEASPSAQPNLSHFLEDREIDGIAHFSYGNCVVVLPDRGSVHVVSDDSCSSCSPSRNNSCFHKKCVGYFSYSIEEVPSPLGLQFTSLHKQPLPRSGSDTGFTVFFLDQHNVYVCQDESRIQCVRIHDGSCICSDRSCNMKKLSPCPHVRAIGTSFLSTSNSSSARTRRFREGEPENDGNIDAMLPCESCRCPSHTALQCSLSKDIVNVGSRVVLQSQIFSTNCPLIQRYCVLKNNRKSLCLKPIDFSDGTSRRVPKDTIIHLYDLAGTTLLHTGEPNDDPFYEDLVDERITPILLENPFKVLRFRCVDGSSVYGIPTAVWSNYVIVHNQSANGTIDWSNRPHPLLKQNITLITDPEDSSIVFRRLVPDPFGLPSEGSFDLTFPANDTHSLFDSQIMVQNLPRNRQIQ